MFRIVMAIFLGLTTLSSVRATTPNPPCDRIGSNPSRTDCSEIIYDDEWNELYYDEEDDFSDDASSDLSDDIDNWDNSPFYEDETTYEEIPGFEDVFPEFEEEDYDELPEFDDSDVITPTPVVSTAPRGVCATMAGETDQAIVPALLGLFLFVTLILIRRR